MCREPFLVTLSSRDLKVSTHGIPLLAVVCSVVWGLGKVAEAGPAIDFPLEFSFEPETDINRTKLCGQRKWMEMD